MNVIFSTFADTKDVKAFHKCKASGGSDEFCFTQGDNGIGCTGLDVSDPNIPYVALPPDDWMPKFGDKHKAMGQFVDVTIAGITKRCILGDRMPYKRNITNGCGLDLAPGAQRLFNLKPPCTGNASWAWAV